LIASVRGRIIARGADHVVVEASGVGYKVFVPRHPAGDEALLHTHQVVREDGQFLFGFETGEELALFELIIGVSGVGPRAALAILSVSRPVDVAAASRTGRAAGSGWPAGRRRPRTSSRSTAHTAHRSWVTTRFAR